MAVRSRLKVVAVAIRELRSEIEVLESRLSETDAVDGDRLEAHRIAEALGAEATRVLESAHLAAQERAERAEREAAAVREEALTAADATRTLAKTESDGIIEVAKRDAENLVEDGRAHGRHMVAEAQTVRERMLGDLSRKRQTGRAQVEQLRAARDRLLESLAVVQQSLDSAMADLVGSIPEARAAAQRAGMRIKDEPIPTARHMEAEIEAARAVGHPLVQDIGDPGPELTFGPGEVEPSAQLKSLEGTSDDRPEFFDVEAAVPPEAGSPPEREAGSPPEPEVESPSEPEVESPSEPEAGRGPDVQVDGVDDLFAKLRSSSTDIDTGTGTVRSEPVPEVEAESLVGDVSAGRRQTAASRTARALKKVVVDEQGALLDGIRRSGVEALRELVDDPEGHFTAYDEAALSVLKGYAVEIGAPGEIDLTGALGQLHSMAIDPIRYRLSEFVRRDDEGDEPDASEVSDAVRAMYRESRSRRVPEAAAAAVVAVEGLVVIATGPSKVRWVVDPDGPCGPDCADNALAGEVDPGAPFPTGDTHPPAHVACTCRLVPVAM